MRIPAKMIDTLSVIRDLLLRGDFPGQAAFIEGAIRMAREDSDDFATSIAGVDMWGGSGAVWDVCGFGGRGAPEDEAKRDETAFRKAVIRLAEEMDELGIGTERSRYIADLFRQWQKQGLL